MNSTASLSAQPLVVKTSKEWVLPPRPKPGRKPTDLHKEKKKKVAIRSKACSGMATNLEVIDLNKNIGLIEKENSHLKTHLLSIIHEYKHLKKLVLNRTSVPLHLTLETSNNVRKRSFTELNDSMNDLINNMNDLSYSPPMDEEINSPEPDEFLNFINYDHLLDEEIEEDEYIDSPALSRTSSPASDFESSLMTSLTRSTTVSTNNSNFEKKNFKFYELPTYSTEQYSFKFDQIDPNDKKLMSIIQEDKYNMVTDFLEEKLINNDLNYYEEQQQNM